MEIRIRTGINKTISVPDPDSSINKQKNLGKLCLNSFVTILNNLLSLKANKNVHSVSKSKKVYPARTSVDVSADLDTYKLTDQ